MFIPIMYIRHKSGFLWHSFTPPYKACLQLYVKVQVVVPMLSQIPSHEDVDGSGGITPLILNLGTRWM
jgi:hypothetical protein